jgi:hypothetical protein
MLVLIAINKDTSVFGALYTFPVSLAQGQYHFHVNISNNFTSMLSDTFKVMTPQFGCLNPPIWKNISSISDLNYCSFCVTGPTAGHVATLGANNARTILVGWDYVVYMIFLGMRLGF